MSSGWIKSFCANPHAHLNTFLVSGAFGLRCEFICYSKPFCLRMNSKRWTELYPHIRWLSLTAAVHARIASHNVVERPFSLLFPFFFFLSTLTLNFKLPLTFFNRMNN